MTPFRLASILTGAAIVTLLLAAYGLIDAVPRLLQ